jgi:isochorismate synthase
MSLLIQKIQKHLDSKLPFVGYCKPNSDRLIGLFQRNNQLHSLNQIISGFAFVSFDSDSKYGIPDQDSDVYFESISNIEGCHISYKVHEVDALAKLNFESLVEKALGEINSGTFEKVVLSRNEVVELSNFTIEKVFSSLIIKYPNSFRYCFYHPEIGLWMGASPEQLLKSNQNKAQTVSLAGTQLNSDNQNFIWGEKEITEQQTVTKYIVDALKSCGAEVVKSEPYTFQAGSIVHIKTDIEAQFESEVNVLNLLELLHPTPAVCGFPKNETLEFISATEGYDREFYAGYLGEWNQDGNFDLYVNLRCMNLEITEGHAKAKLFIGCGINSGSQPENEFFETVNKSQTLKSILN